MKNLTNIPLSLFPNIITNKDVSIFIREIDDFIIKIFESRDSLEEKINDSFSENKSKIILKILKDFEIDINNISRLNDFFGFLKNSILQWPTLSIELSEELPRKVIRRISDWFIVNNDKRVILDIKINRKMLGGVSLYVDGKYYDYSLRKKINEMIYRGNLNLSNLLSNN